MNDPRRQSEGDELTQFWKTPPRSLAHEYGSPKNREGKAARRRVWMGPGGGKREASRCLLFVTGRLGVAIADAVIGMIDDGGLIVETTRNFAPAKKLPSGMRGRKS